MREKEYFISKLAENRVSDLKTSEPKELNTLIRKKDVTKVS